MQNIKDIDLLQKTILIQSCLIAGHSIEAIFRKESEYLLGQSNANMIALCVSQKDSLKLEFILDRKATLHEYLKRYHVQSHTLVLDSMKEKFAKYFRTGKEFYQTDSLKDLLVDSLANHKIKHFEELHKFTEMTAFPMYSKTNDDLIGYLLFCFLDNGEPNLPELRNITRVVQNIITPFHDSKSKTFRSRCVQVLTDVPVLTSKEKHVLKQLLAANSYAEIADTLHISVNTVKTHIKNIYAKYEVNSKLELSNKINGGSA